MKMTSSSSSLRSSHRWLNALPCFLLFITAAIIRPQGLHAFPHALPHHRNVELTKKVKITATTTTATGGTPATATSTATTATTSRTNKEIGTFRKRSVLRMQKPTEGSLEGKPSFVFKLNASTKWLVTLANTYGVWYRPQSYVGPYIVLGSICAVFYSDALKQWINQGRPAGSPFTDPGMPSSHALVSFFSAAAWATAISGAPSPLMNIPNMLLYASAISVSLLRVVCGYHSFAQIIVGGSLGTFLGWGWTRFGVLMNVKHETFAYFFSWSMYIAGAALFISKNMKDWVSKDRNL